MKILEQMAIESQFTKTELVVVQTIQSNLMDFHHMTIRKLAKESYSSNATIIRICRKLGFLGYRDFKIALITELESQKYITNNVNYSIPFQKEEATISIVNSIFSLYKDGISVIQSNLDLHALEDIASCLMKAERIFVFAIGDAQITATGFINKMVKLNYFLVLASEYREEEAILKHITPKDCALFITYSGKKTEHETCFRALHKKGVPSIILTANEKTILAKYATHRLILPDMEQDEKIATFYSQFGFTYYLSLIYSLIYHETK